MPDNVEYMKSTYRNVCGTVFREKIHKLKAAEGMTTTSAF